MYRLFPRMSRVNGSRIINDSIVMSVIDDMTQIQILLIFIRLIGKK